MDGLRTAISNARSAGTAKEAQMAEPSQVYRQTARLVALTAEALKIQSEIEMRLGGALRPLALPEQHVATGSAPHEVLVPLAEELASSADKVEALINQQQSLLQRLEL